MAGGREPASRLAHLCGYPPLALVLRYADPRTRFDHLTVADDDTLNMRIALAASYQDLPPEAARMFRLAGRSGGAVTVSRASALAGCPPAGAARQIDLLARCHMPEIVGGFAYRLPPLLRIFAAECAEAQSQDDQAARARVSNRVAATKLELFERIRRDSSREGASIRALARKYWVHRRLVRKALGACRAGTAEDAGAAIAATGPV